MPLDNPEPKLLGTEIDGTQNHDYCVYCYKDGAFTNPGMSLDEMKTLVKEQMEERQIDSSTINMAVSSLSHLKRWRGASSYALL